MSRSPAAVTPMAAEAPRLRRYGKYAEYTQRQRRQPAPADRWGSTKWGSSACPKRVNPTTVNAQPPDEYCTTSREFRGISAKSGSVCPAGPPRWNRSAANNGTPNRSPVHVSEGNGKGYASPSARALKYIRRRLSLFTMSRHAGAVVR